MGVQAPSNALDATPADGDQPTSQGAAAAVATTIVLLLAGAAAFAVYWFKFRGNRPAAVAQPDKRAGGGSSVTMMAAPRAVGGAGTASRIGGPAPRVAMSAFFGQPMAHVPQHQWQPQAPAVQASNPLFPAAHQPQPPPMASFFPPAERPAMAATAPDAAPDAAVPATVASIPVPGTAVPAAAGVAASAASGAASATASRRSGPQPADGSAGHAAPKPLPEMAAGAAEAGAGTGHGSCRAGAGVASAVSPGSSAVRPGGDATHCGRGGSRRRARRRHGQPAGAGASWPGASGKLTASEGGARAGFPAPPAAAAGSAHGGPTASGRRTRARWAHRQHDHRPCGVFLRGAAGAC